MAWNGIFKEAATTGKRELTVKKQAFSDEDATAIETWNDETLFKVRGLNHLRLMGFSSMTSFSPQISQLNSLLELILTNNGLESLPEEIGSLTRLRLLDASHNQLKLLPQSFYSLSSLQKLLLAHNQLCNDSFPPQSAGSGSPPFPSLQYIDMSHNEMEELPEFVYQSVSVLELLSPHNKIQSLLSDVSNLSNLKTLDLTHNSIIFLPAELSQCAKLRFISFDDNQIQDRRLVKILNQFGETKPKAVLDYLTSSKTGKGGGGKGKKKKGGASVEDTPSEIVHARYIIKIVRPEQYVMIKSMNAARQVRPYLVCAVIRNLALDEDGALRAFITLQTKLHETVCKKRRLATIATHSLSSLSLPLSYQCRSPDRIKLQPLDWDKEVTVRQFISHLKSNKPDRAREGSKPYSVDVSAAHLSKFLPLVDSNLMVYLSDSSGTVFSLPPLTNSEPSKITEATRDVLVEVTSSTSLSDAKQAMSALLLEMIDNGLHSVSTDVEEAATPKGPPQLIVEQTKVIDEADKLLVMYPARPDLILDSATKIDVMRPV
ncbi:PREDICTED: leucine-rich repeat-containing protein 47-like [Amphimedon queenslandica]|uniref:B3/B4 tRNA-binding domain-containing protein n=1 Tax=Amphimedon queenslandica TaxID=400682 RepID=A0A1X7TY91_AMPQE|nr:PREDICTED: leucine-rich repeat-containing protein 47-like [Amphimedon queenslandica]|eukprot:XP_019857026.1 PREDICTED: leucine-rich repeat-containing protein 47-like [Amphimedon queenslandica]